jgi:hypothetical protein
MVVRHATKITNDLQIQQQALLFLKNFNFYLKLIFFMFLDDFDDQILKINFKK